MGSRAFTIRWQSGLSLVGLMIGMLLSMLTLTAALVLYRNMVSVSVDSRLDSSQDGQMASAMLMLQLQVQSAGFGFAAGAGSHLFPSAVGATQVVYWRYKPVATPLCQGFRIQDDNTAGTRQLQLLSAASCDESSALESLTWSVQTVLAEFRKAAGADWPLIEVSRASGNCFPFGMSAQATHPQIVIGAESAAVRAARDASLTAPSSLINYTFCLANI